MPSCGSRRKHERAASRCSNLRTARLECALSSPRWRARGRSRAVCMFVTYPLIPYKHLAFARLPQKQSTLCKQFSLHYTRTHTPAANRTQASLSSSSSLCEATPLYAISPCRRHFAPNPVCSTAHLPSLAFHNYKCIYVHQRMHYNITNLYYNILAASTTVV